MTPRKKLIFVILSYLAYFLVVFILTLYFSFPYERLKKVLEYNLGNSFGMKLKIDKLTPYFFHGIKVEGIRFTPYTTNSEETPPPPLIIDSVTIKISVLSLLIGKSALIINSDFLDGNVDLRVEINDNLTTTLKMERLNLKRFAPIKNFLPLPVKGEFSGRGKLVIVRRDISKAEGNLNLNGIKITIGDGKTPIPIPGQKDGIILPTIEIKKLSLSIDIKKGVATIKKFSTQSDELELIGEGKIYLSKEPSNIRFDTYIRFKFKKGFEKKGDIAAGIIAALDFIPNMKRAKRSDGFYGFLINGTVARGLNFTPTQKYSSSPTHIREKRFGPYKNRLPLIDQLKKPFKNFGPELNIK